MMRMWQISSAAVVALLMGGATMAAAPQAAPSTALSRLETGRYELKEVGSLAEPRLVCLADAAMLIQLQHPGTQCSRLIVADGADSTTINYTCAGGGHGRTVVTITTPRSFDLQTQGISSGAPFDMDYQGRRVGACGARSNASR
jgi:hypothetical protein